MDIRDFEKEVHQNAVDHGWWESNRGIAEIVALIHSEWSEALEEYRSGRPMVWYSCTDNNHEDCITVDPGNCRIARNGLCPHKKPEGIVVELIDGCIRVLDYLGKEDVQIHGIETFEELMKEAPEAAYKVELPQLIANLHLKTSQAYNCIRISEKESEMSMAISLSRGYAIMFEIIAVAFCWIMDHGHAPLSIMQEKHAYNRTRPYKHGGKTC